MVQGRYEVTNALARFSVGGRCAKSLAPKELLLRTRFSMQRPIWLSVLLLFLLGAASSVAAQTYHLNWAAGSPGGAWHTQATGVTALITEKNPDITFELFPGGGRDNPTRIQSGDSQIGLGIDFLSRAAKRGESPYGRAHD